MIVPKCFFVKRSVISKDGNVTRDFGSVINVISILLFYPILAQCSEKPTYKNNKIESVKNSSCARAMIEGSGRYALYSLSIKSGFNPESQVCRFVRDFVSSDVQGASLAVMHFTPSIFEGVPECETAAVVPPLHDGSHQPLQQQISQASFETQVQISLSALHVRRCFERLYPSSWIQGVKEYRRVDIILNWLRYRNERPSFQLSSNNTQVDFAPIAVYYAKDKIVGIACAQISYGEVKAKVLHDAYRACLSNAASIISSGEN